MKELTLLRNVRCGAGGAAGATCYPTSPMASVEGDRMSTGHTASMDLMDTDRGIGAFALRPIRAGERIIAEKPLLELALDDIEGSLN